MNILMIAGNVGKDAELRRTQGGDAVLGFSVAVDQGKDKSGNKREALWVDCSVWGKRAESLEAYVKKGTKLALQGRPTVREHNGKAYLGMAVNELTFMGGGQSDGHRGEYGGGNSGGYGSGGSPNSGGDMGGELPFAPIKLI